MTTPQTEPALQAEQEPLQEELVAPVAKPALVRAGILGAKKPLLLDLCKAYNLDLSGTKEQLKAMPQFKYSDYN